MLENFSYNPNAFDTDADSIAFSIAPFFASGYNFPQTTDSITINTKTGELIWDKPTIPENYALAILLTEWRSGAVIGTEYIPLIISVIEPTLSVNSTKELNRVALFPDPLYSIFYN